MTMVNPGPARRREDAPRRTPRKRQPRYGGYGSYGVPQTLLSGSRFHRVSEQQAEMTTPQLEGILTPKPPGLQLESPENQVSTNVEPHPSSEAILTQIESTRVFVNHVRETGTERISKLLDLVKYLGNEDVQDPPLPIEEDRFPADDLIDEWFGGLEADAESAGNPVPSQGVVDEAKRIVLGLRRFLPTDTDVHTWDDGEVAVEVFGVRDRGFLLLCEPGGSALCVVTIDNVARRSRYESSSRDLPDGFLKEGLRAVLSLA